MKSNEDKQFERIAASMQQKEGRFNGQLVAGMILAFVIQVLLFSLGVWLVTLSIFRMFDLSFEASWWLSLLLGTGYALITLVLKGFDFD